MPRKPRSPLGVASHALAAAASATKALEDSTETEDGTEEGTEETGAASIPKRAFAEIYRTQASGELGYLGRLDERQLTQSAVADRWGGGDYRIQLYGTHKATGRWGKLSVRTMVIDPDVRPKPQAVEVNGNGGGPPAGGGMESVVSQALMNMMQFQQQQMTAFAQGQQQLQQMTMAVVASMIEGKKQDPVMGTILQAVLTKQEKDPTETALAIVAAMKGSGERSSAAELIDAYRMLDELRGGSAREEKTDDKMWEMGTKLVEVIAAKPPAVPLAAPPPVMGQGVVLPPTEVRPPPPLWHQLLIRYRNLLLDQARRGTDPADVADLTLRFIPEDQMGVLLELLAAPDVVERLNQALPDLHQFPSWTTKLVDALRAGVAEETVDDTSTEEA